MTLIREEYGLKPQGGVPYHLQQIDRGEVSIGDAGLIHVSAAGYVLGSGLSSGGGCQSGAPVYRETWGGRGWRLAL